MTKKFDPAPLDKHAADPNEAAKADRDMQAKLKSGLLRHLSGIRPGKHHAATIHEA